MDPRTRRQVLRYGAPAAFLAAVTIAVLLVKAGLSGGDGSTVGALPTTAPTTTAATTTTKLVLTGTATDTTAAEGQYYVIKSGDTLGSVAAKYNTTVEKVMALNPGVDPTTLHIGQRIRVG